MSSKGKYEQFATVRECDPQGDILHVFGDVDLSTASELNRSIDEALAECATLKIDLTECRYFDSSGLATLARARQHLGSALTVVVRPHTGVYRTLRVVGFDKIFNLVTQLQPDGLAHRKATGGVESMRAGC